MATDALSYTGINRAYSDFAGSRACEELINLRPATEGVVPVKDFSVKMADMPFSRIYVHHTTSGPHYIVVRAVSDEDTVLVQYVDEDGEEVQTLFSTPYDGLETIDSISYATAGNILVISLWDKENNRFKNAAYTWGMDANGDFKYIETEANVPKIDFSVTDDDTVVTVTEDIAKIDVSSESYEVVSAVETALNAAQEHNPELCLGPIVIAIAYKTKDGSTFWTNGWMAYDPEPLMRSSSLRYKNASYSWWANDFGMYTAFYAKYPDGGYVLSGLTFETAELGQITKIDLPGTNVKVHFEALSDDPTSPSYWNPETSAIQSIEVYCSRPTPYLDAQAAYDGFHVLVGATQAAALMLPKADYNEMDLGGQLLYHQASIPMASLLENDQDVTLSFGGNIQVTNETLEVDSGALKRYGKVLAYNARFHYYDSVSKMTVGKPTFLWTGGGSTFATTVHVFARYADAEHSELLYLGTAPSYTVGNAYLVIAPSVNIKEVITYRYDGTDSYEKNYRMAASSSYNYSICTEGPISEVTYYNQQLTDYENLISGGVKDLTYYETDVINVSEQYNPFVFLVEHSYKAPGNILDVKPQMAGIVDSSYGRDPLNVFTERGVYALTQGSANVLYGAFLPVTSDVVSAASVPTEMGIFYLAGGSLWLLSGRRATLVSDALHLGPHKYVRACPGYKKISGDQDGVILTPEYDVTNLVSAVTFEEFVRTGGRLSFDRFRMEILVSNPNYNYTYVLSLKYRQWFKLGRRLWQDESGSDIASTPGATAGHINVVDLASEETGSVLVHLQSRPFSMGYRYIHMHRIVSMVRARLSGTAGDKLVVALYGSDDLQEWKLLAYSKRVGRTTSTTDDPPVVTDHPLKVSQIRTAPSARSWRYYTVCIGGQVPTDTDLGPVLVDYEPVIRRIG